MIAAPRRIAPALVAVCLAAALGGCGSSDEPVTKAANEGVYVDINDVAYQVQISRVLNPKAAEDASYLVGLPPATPPLAPDEQWFAVFLRAQNYGSSPTTLANRFRIVDTDVPRGAVYLPTPIDPKVNIFAWNPTDPLDADFVYPNPSSIAGTGPVREGAELLFRVKDSVYQNRPLVLQIVGDNGRAAAAVSLDL